MTGNDGGLACQNVLNNPEHTCHIPGAELDQPSRYRIKVFLPCTYSFYLSRVEFRV